MAFHAERFIRAPACRPGKDAGRSRADLHLVFQDYPKSEAFIADAAPIHVVQPARGPFDIGYVKRCAELLRRLGTTHLHAHFGTDAYLAVAAARLARIDRR
ncbi:MAG: hypothetical protein C0524_04340, partial [Rhodobacter sp.]|nr:hypothetical protein [Rhodobacter sp.]